MLNALVIYPNIQNLSEFLDGIKSSTQIINFEPISLSNKYQSIGFVWENSPDLHHVPWGKTFKLDSNKWFSDEFILFINLNPGITIHLITCNLFAESFIVSVNKLNKIYPNVKIGYAVGEIGSEPGTWYLDNLNINIKSIYFSNKILLLST